MDANANRRRPRTSSSAITALSSHSGAANAVGEAAPLSARLSGGAVSKEGDVARLPDRSNAGGANATGAMASESRL